MKFRITVVFAALLLVLTGCSTTTGGSSASDNTLAVGVQYPIENLDPHGPSAADSGTQLAAKAVFSPLIRTAGEGKYEGDLAEKWSANDDGTEWTFTLREGLTFSDNRPVTANDVVASFNRVIEEGGPQASNFKGHTATPVDDHTVTISSKSPDAALLGKLTGFFVTPVDAAEKGFSNPIGSGPFTVESFEPGSTLRLTANPKYWRGAPKLQQLEFRTIPEIAARMTALQNDEIQLTWGMPDDQVMPLRDNDQLTVQTIPANSVITMWMNSSTPALKDAPVRRALWQAVDFETIIKSLFPETGSPADSVVTPDVLGYAAQQKVEHDPAAARAALQQAEFDFNQTLRFQYSQPQFSELTRAVASDLEKVGVKVDVMEKEPAVFLDDLLAMNWDINIQSLGAAGFDAATNLGRLYPCAAKRTGYCNPELDKLLADAESTSDPVTRKKLYASATEIVWNDAVGMYPMFAKLPYAWNKSVTGFEPAADGLPFMDSVSVGG